MSRVIELIGVDKVFHAPLGRYAGVKSLILRPRQTIARLRDRSFLALQDVALTVDEGETFGIVGRNGAGKTTLLALIAGILKPSRGEVRVRGRVSPILELGIGFDHHLSGRDNALLYGVMLGQRRREVERRLEEIVAFAGLEAFIDQPLLTYSSGMLLRLAFSTAILSNPEVLLVDEALAVGDEEYRIKCLRQIDELRRSGVTIVFVSHQLDLIEKICDRAAWLAHGRVAAVGPAGEVVQRYRHDTAETLGGNGIPIEWRGPSDGVA